MNPNISKLSPEQLKIFERWEREKKERLNLLNKLESEIGNPAFILKQLQELEPDYCEHGRYKMGTCTGCDEIERILFPEKFDDED